MRVLCPDCRDRPVTFVPEASEPGRCRVHAIEYWTGVVRTGAALAQLSRAVDGVPLAPVSRSDEVICPVCQSRVQPQVRRAPWLKTVRSRCPRCYNFLEVRRRVA